MSIDKITFAFKNMMNQKVGRLEEKWKYDSGSSLLSSPVVADINNDGKKEIIFGTKDGKLISIDISGKIQWMYNTQQNYSETELMFLDTDTANSINASPNIEDINNDGKKEILFGTETGTLYVLDSQGKPFWTYRTGGPIRGTPLVQSFANNEKGILFGSLDCNLYFLNGKGQLLWKYDCGTEIESCPALIMAKKPLIVFGDNKGTLHAIDLNARPVWTFKTDGKILAQPVFEQITPTLEPVIIVGSTDGSIYCLRANGELVWQYKTGGAICSKAVAADIDRDGKKEIIFGSCDNCVYAINSDGKKIWSYETDFWVVASPVVSDMDGDGRLEVVVGSYDHNIYILDAEGTYVLDYVPGVSGIVTQTGQYGDALTSEPGKTQGKKIWQYQTEGIVVGCVFVQGEKNLIVNTESGKIDNIIHKIE